MRLRCSRFNVSIWLPPPRVVLPLLNRAITLHQPKKRSQKQSFVQDSRMSMHLSRSVGRVSAVTDCKHCCSVERVAMRAQRSNAWDVNSHMWMRWMCLTGVCLHSTGWERWSLPRKRLQLFQQREMSLICTAASLPSRTSAPLREIDSYTGKYPEVLYLDTLRANTMVFSSPKVQVT